MGLRASPKWLLLWSLTSSCGGLRGDSPGVQPGPSSLGFGGRVQAQVVRVEPSASTAQLAAAPAPELAAEPESPEARLAREYPLHATVSYFMAQVFVDAAQDAQPRGYLRRGARLRLKPGVRAKGCDAAWHEVLGGGFICAARGLVIGTTPQSFSPSPLPPHLNEDLPYDYTKVMGTDVAQYLRVPTADEERDVATIVAADGEKARAEQAQDGLLDKVEHALAKVLDSKPVADTRTVGTAATPLPGLLKMVMQPGFYVSADGREQVEGRDWVRTVRGSYLRADAVSDVAVPPLGGMRLGADTPLPVGLVQRTGVPSYRRDPQSGALVRTQALALMQGFSLRDESVLLSGRRYRATDGGLFVPEDSLRIVRRVPRPPLVAAGSRWISIELSSQTLVAYEGDEPVFATLVSTGKEGYETPTGIFRIQSKHVSTTMDGEMGTDEAYSIEDVPWTQYFAGSIALHAAFWHKGFGRVRSHGCVNLAPADARLLFQWSTPSLPSGYHGIQATRGDLGTFVEIHP